MNESGERSPEKDQDPRVKAGVKRFFEAFTNDPDNHGAVYNEVLNTIPVELDEEFQMAMMAEAEKRGIDLDWKGGSDTHGKSSETTNTDKLARKQARLMDQLNEAELTEEQIRNLKQRIEEVPNLREAGYIESSINVLNKKQVKSKPPQTSANRKKSPETPDTRGDAERRASEAVARENLAREAAGTKEVPPQETVAPVKKVRTPRYRDDAPDDFPQKARAAANPDAKGIPFGDDKRDAVFEMHGDRMYIRHGRAVREARPDEIAAHFKFEAKERPKTTGTVEAGVMNDVTREDLFDATGNVDSKLLNGLNGLSDTARERTKESAKKRTLDDQRNDFAKDTGKVAKPLAELRGKLSRGVRDPSKESHESIHQEKISDMAEILANPRRQVMFGEFIASQGKADLIEKYHEAQNNPSALNIPATLALQDMLRAFDKRFAAVEAIKAGITKGDVEEFIRDRDNQDLKFLGISTNSDRAFEIVRDALDHTLMVMPENEYVSVIDAMKKTNAIRNDYRYKAMTERARKAVKDEGINPEDLKWETVEKNSYLLNAIRKPKFLDWAFGDESSKNSQEMLDAIKYNRKVAGVLLATAISNDPLLKKRLLEEVHTRTKSPETAEQGIASYAEVMSKSELALKPENWTEELKKSELREQIMPKGKWDTSTEDERADAFSEHLQKSGGDIYTRRGWLAGILKAIFGTGVRKTTETLKAQGAFK